MELAAQFSGWRSVIKEFQKEIDGSSIHISNLFLLFGRGFSDILPYNIFFYILFLKFSCVVTICDHYLFLFITTLLSK